MRPLITIVIGLNNQELPKSQSGKVLRRILATEERQKLAAQQVIEEIKR